MKNFLEYTLFVTFSFIVRLFSLNGARKLAGPVASIFYKFIPIRKNTVIDNLKLAFPDYSEQKINEIAYGCYKSFVITMIETLYLPKLDEQTLSKNMVCSNLNLIKEKHSENKGLILLSAHFGNWEYLAISTAAQVKIPYSVVIKEQRNGYVSKWLNHVRTKFINKIVPLGISIRTIYKELLDKNVVALVADQRGPQEGLRINFFGRQVPVYPGPAALALKTKAPMLYGLAVRQPDYTYKVELVEIPYDDLTGTEEEKILQLSQRHTSYLEEMIKKYPEQWLWMHKRWKY